MQEDAEFDGYEIEFGRSFDLGSGELALSFGRDVVNAEFSDGHNVPRINPCLLYTSPSPRDQRGSRMPSSA